MGARFSPASPPRSFTETAATAAGSLSSPGPERAPGDVRRACSAACTGAPCSGCWAEAFGPEHLHLGCRAEGLEEHGQRIRVSCSSGAVFEGGVVVGADGVHSLVRDWVTGGDEPVYSGTSGFRGLVPIERLPRLPDPGALQFSMGPAPTCCTTRSTAAA